MLNAFFVYCVFAALLFVGFQYVAATLLAGCAGVIAGYWGHGAIVFRDLTDRSLWRFIAVFLLCFILNIAMQSMLQDHYNAYLAGGLALVVTVPISFVLNRWLVFRRA